MTIEPNGYKKLKQRNYNLVVENEFLKEKLEKESFYYKWQNTLDEVDRLFQENQNLKKEIVDLKTEIVDHRVKEYRLTKILNETSDYT